MKPFRLGVFGGTFDPVHLGHLQLAQLAIKEVGLSKLLFIPAAQPPHKHGVITPMKHRVAMLELICQGNTHLACDTIERDLPRPSYTVDTLSELKKRYPKSAEMYFVLGGDAFLDIMTWKAYTTLISMVRIVVSPRLGYSNHLLYSFLKQLGYTHKDGRWQGQNGQKEITVLSEPPRRVCSSKLRKVIAEGGDTSSLLSDDVAGYIEENNLYKL